MAFVTLKPFADKVIAITGAGSGIGRATAIYLGRYGASLAISDVNKTAVDKVAAEIITDCPDAKVIASAVDVSEADQVKAWVDQAIDTFGRLDGAANIAGTGGPPSQTALESQSDAVWKLIIDVNLSGVMYCMREELRVLSDGGAIVNASSVLGLRSAPDAGGSPYVASKHGVLGLTKTAAREYGHRNIRINCVNPGAINTPMMQPQEGAENSISDIHPPIARMGTPEEVAQLVGFLLGEESRYITGTSVVIDGGLIC
ncbi:3-oxoacyl-reductase [Dactylonectria estremocensis]|uniref:3-oxoacyl-reductase n=1 Tax=Dactylonectria estremocensis TaxID=1079267 RepID=A0A9P9IBL6_9HYPO|nr:3-oxoacyl-reductase [Dactylonectria estremocensis]